MEPCHPHGCLGSRATHSRQRGSRDWTVCGSRAALAIGAAEMGRSLALIIFTTDNAFVPDVKQVA